MALERLRVIIDVQAHNAKKALSDFGSSIRSADGFAGKFKAGWSSAATSIKANAASIALVAGGALVAFGAKALSAFTTASKAAIDFGKATNTTTEQASRWIQVAKDYGVSLESLQSAMGKVGRKGIDFVDAMETINDTAPVDRARVAAELFGKGWQSVAPLIGKTREEYEQMLGAVSDGQVITDKEAAKAERMRLAQDALGDAFESVTLAVGSLVAEMAPLIEGAAEAAEGFAELVGEAGPYLAILGDIAQIGNPFAWDDMIGDTITDFVALGSGISATVDGLDLMSQAEVDTAARADELADAFDGVSGAIDDVSDSYAVLLDSFETADAIDNVMNAFEDLETSWIEAAEAQAAGSEDADRKTREAAAAVRDLQSDVIAYGDTVKGLDPQRITEILALIDQGSVDEARALFAILTAGETKTITVYTKFEGDLGPKIPRRARGGPAGGLTLVGEEGPELVNLPGGSFVHTAGQTKGMLSGGGSSGGGSTNVTVNVNVGPGADPVSVGRATADALAAYYRNGGQRP